MALTSESVHEILSLTIHMKAMPSSTFLWCCLLCCTVAVLTFVPTYESVHENHVVWLFNRKLLSGTFHCYSIILCKVVLPIESVDEILQCDYSKESY